MVNKTICFTVKKKLKIGQVIKYLLQKGIFIIERVIWIVETNESFIKLPISKNTY